MITNYYSFPYLTRGEQREFGWATTKLIRPLKAGIGRTRRKVADKLYESGNQKLVKARERAQQVLKNGVKNKTLRNQILRNEAPKAKTTVSYRANDIASQGGGGAAIYKSDVDGRTREFLDNPFVGRGEKQLIKKITKGERASGIAISKGRGEEVLAHELGHARGKVSNGIRGLISRSDPRSAIGYQGSVSVYKKGTDPTKRVGFIQSVKDHLSGVKNSKLVIAEENAASREGLNILKRNGATKEELAKARENLRAAGDTYRLVGKKAARSSLGRIIDIPSRRGTKNIVL